MRLARIDRPPQPAGMDQLTTALDRLRRFRDTFNDGEPVDEESRLFADDLTTIICAVEAFGEDAVAGDPKPE
ncbi:hypothetical protein LPN01_09775 [Sphingomonas sp. A2-49]|uniref:hypothetical protein n=1 Tax=Sphingomonas sp. A2-49 TaxID=1391375 RepID=UPI0021D14AA2|nr:hypothetical protein [Sphingomonas sp. A2-49]MCU6454368.1 hypothetical protein [Sphingomonas sp. A2-49]